MCPFEERVTAWLLKDLSSEEMQAMTRHLEVCAECRAVRDDCADVLTPLRSALMKDHVAAAVTAAAARRATGSRKDGRGTMREWFRVAAIFMASFGVLGALLAIAHWRTKQGMGVDGNVTHITFLKGDNTAIPSLDALPDESKPAPPALAGLPEGRLFEPDGKGLAVGTGTAPAAVAPSRFPGLLNPADVVRASEAMPQIRPMAEMKARREPAIGETAIAKRGRVRREGESDSPAYPQAKPIMLAGAVPAEDAADTNNVTSATNAPAQPQERFMK